MRVTRRAMAGLASLPLLPAVPAAARQAIVWPTNVTESPFGPSARAVAAIRDAATRAALYPHPEEDRLIARIAEVNGVAPEQVAITSGALEVLSILSLLWTAGGVQVAPELTYDTHVRYALRNGAQARRVAMRPDQGIDLDAVSMATADVKLTYLCLSLIHI